MSCKVMPACSQACPSGSFKCSMVVLWPEILLQKFHSDWFLRHNFFLTGEPEAFINPQGTGIYHVCSFQRPYGPDLLPRLHRRSPDDGQSFVRLWMEELSEHVQKMNDSAAGIAMMQCPLFFLFVQETDLEVHVCSLNWTVYWKWTSWNNEQQAQHFSIFNV
jgi:hypothetical protein